MGLREAVEEKISINDKFSEAELRDLIRFKFGLAGDSHRMISRMATHLLAFLETPDPDENEKDELRMRVVTAEVEQEKAEKALAECRERIRQWADKLESPLAARGDIDAADAIKVEEMRKFIE